MRAAGVSAPAAPHAAEYLTLRAPDGKIVRASRKSYGLVYASHGFEIVDAPVYRRRILAIVHKYPPAHNAGAEMMLHAIARRLAAAGDHVRIACVWAGPGAWYELDGVEVIAVAPERLSSLAARADVVITHLDLTRVAIEAAAAARKPLVHLVHNDEQIAFHGVRPRDAALVVYNSEWLRRAGRGFRARSMICRPPVELERYTTTPGDAVTLLNLTIPKGVQTFYAAARRLPELPFLGVAGAYGQQIFRNDVGRNVTRIANTPNVREDVYARTRILLAPSSYESWGRVVIEAACSGIPSIVHPTPGLLEALSSAGTFVDREDVEGYVREIRRLMVDEEYAEAGARARDRAEELAVVAEDDLAALEAALAEVAA